MMDTCTCKVPGCDRPADFFVPDDWCEEHWQLWFDWPEGLFQPIWMDVKKPK